MDELLLPLVSVIIAFYNDGAYLSEAIESVIKQEFTDWELLLIDDGSTDAGTSIAKGFAMQNEGRIFYTEHAGHANKGVCVSRNLGVSMARGKYVALLDGDDVWLSKKLSVQVDLMLIHPEVSMVCEASEYWYDWDDKAKQNEIIHVGTERDKLFFPPELVNELYPLAYGRAPVPSGIMLQRTAITKHGGFEEGFTGIYQLYEDQAFLMKIYLNEPVYISSTCNHQYRQRAGSVVQKVTVKGQYYVVRRYFLEWLERYLEEEGIHGKNVNKLLRRALVPYHEPLRHYLQQFKQRMVNRMTKRLHQ